MQLHTPCVCAFFFSLSHSIQSFRRHFPIKICVSRFQNWIPLFICSMHNFRCQNHTKHISFMRIEWKYDVNFVLVRITTIENIHRFDVTDFFFFFFFVYSTTNKITSKVIRKNVRISLFMVFFFLVSNLLFDHIELLLKIHYASSHFLLFVKQKELNTKVIKKR